jgi:hypothetical protein
MPPSDPHFPVRFDPRPWDEDLARSTPNGNTAARNARRDYERSGIPRSRLRPCEADGRDGTNLPDCTKVYLPQPDGRFGMIFTVDRQADKPALEFLAFGVRHHPAGSHAPTVYEIADQRLSS